MYFVLIEADIVDLPALPRLPLTVVETCMLFERSSKPLARPLFFLIYDYVSSNWERPGKGSSSWASFSTTSENLTTSDAYTCFEGSLLS